MQRRKGQFAGKANPQEGASASSSVNPARSSTQDEPPRESKWGLCHTSILADIATLALLYKAFCFYYSVPARLPYLLIIL